MENVLMVFAHIIIVGITIPVLYIIYKTNRIIAICSILIAGALIIYSLINNIAMPISSLSIIWIVGVVMYLNEKIVG